MKTLRVLSLVVCLCLMVGLFAACTSKPAEPTPTPAPASSGGSAATATPAPANEPEPSDEPAPADEGPAYPLICDYGDCELTYFFAIGPTVTTKIESYKDIDANAELERRTGVKINWINPGIQYQAEQYSMMVASDDFPDLVCHRIGLSYPAGPDAAVDNGVFYRLNELIDQYAPNYKAVFASLPEYKDTFTDKGNQWGMYCYYSNATVFYGVSYRKDIGDKIGINTIPETLDEWEDAFQIFIDNGYNEPMFLQNGLNMNGTWLSAFGVGESFYQDNGVVKYGPIQPGFKEYLARMHDWYDKGYMMKDFVGKDTRDMLIADKALVSWASDSLSGDELVASGHVSNPDFYLMPCPHPVLNKGDKVHYRLTATTVDQPTAIATSCKTPELAVKWLDYMFSEEGQFFCNYGVEGVTYEMVNGKPEYTDLITHNDVSVTNTLEAYILFCCTVNTNPSLAFSPSKVLCNQVWSDSPCDQVLPKALVRTSDETARYAAVMTDVETYVSENVAKFIMGTRSLDEFDDYVQVIESTGIADATAIQQAALDRYNGR